MIGPYCVAPHHLVFIIKIRSEKKFLITYRPSQRGERNGAFQETSVILIVHALIVTSIQFTPETVGGICNSP